MLVVRAPVAGCRDLAQDEIAARDQRDREPEFSSRHEVAEAADRNDRRKAKLTTLEPRDIVLDGGSAR